MVALVNLSSSQWPWRQAGAIYNSTVIFKTWWGLQCFAGVQPESNRHQLDKIPAQKRINVTLPYSEIESFRLFSYGITAESKNSASGNFGNRLLAWRLKKWRFQAGLGIRKQSNDINIRNSQHKCTKSGHYFNGRNLVVTGFARKHRASMLRTRPCRRTNFLECTRPAAALVAAK